MCVASAASTHVLGLHPSALGLQALFGTLQLSDEMAQSDPAGLAALAALQQHLNRMLAAKELASTAQLVSPLALAPLRLAAHEILSVTHRGSIVH